MDLFFGIHSWAGNTLSALATIELLMLIGRVLFKLEKQITINRIESLNKVILFVSLIMGVLFFVELLSALRLNDVNEQYVFYNRILGKYWYAYVIMLWGKMIFPQLYWVKALRSNLYVTLAVTVLINLDIVIWLERFIIIVTSFSE